MSERLCLFTFNFFSSNSHVIEKVRIHSHIQKYYFLHVFDITLSIHLCFYRTSYKMLFFYHFPGRVFLLIFDLPILCHLEKSCHSISRILITSLNLLFSSCFKLYFLIFKMFDWWDFSLHTLYLFYYLQLLYLFFSFVHCCLQNLFPLAVSLNIFTLSGDLYMKALIFGKREWRK